MSAKRLSLIAGALALVLWSSAVARPGPVPGCARRHGVVRHGRPDGRRGGQRQERRASTVTISVATDDKGRFSFPASKLEPGQYALSTRAIGYELEGPSNAEMSAGQTANVEIKLGPTKDLTKQMSNAEWFASFPGTDRREQGHPQLRELPQPRPHRALAIRRRAVPGRVQPDGRLLPRQHAGTSAAAGRQRATLARPGRRREGDRGISLA